MARHKHYENQPDADPVLDISSLIDVCFLLLIFFLVTSTISPRESDLAMSLPGPRHTNPAQPEIEPLMIRVEASGAILTGTGEILRQMDTAADSRELPLLRNHLDLYASAARAADSIPLVRIEPDGGTSHQRVIDILNTLAAVGIQSVTFTDPISPR